MLGCALETEHPQSFKFRLLGSSQLERLSIALWRLPRPRVRGFQ